MVNGVLVGVVIITLTYLLRVPKSYPEVCYRLHSLAVYTSIATSEKKLVLSVQSVVDASVT